MKLNRRMFLAKTSILGGGLTAGMLTDSSVIAQETKPGAETWNLEQAVKKKDDRLLNIGGIFGLWSHMSSSWWRYFNPPEGYARATGMRISHVWCVDTPK